MLVIPLNLGGNPISAPGGALTTVSDGTTSYGAGAGGVLNVNSDQVTLSRRPPRPRPNLSNSTATMTATMKTTMAGKADWHNLGAITGTLAGQTHSQLAGRLITLAPS